MKTGDRWACRIRMCSRAARLAQVGGIDAEDRLQDRGVTAVPFELLEEGPKAESRSRLVNS